MAIVVRRNQIRRVVRCLFTTVGLMLALSEPALAQSVASTDATYGSLKADRVDVRSAPGLDQPVAFVFRRAGMPVALLESAKGWQRVRDSEGAIGWVFADLVSRRRTALVLPAAKADGQVAIRSTESVGSAPLAYLEPGVVVGIVSCERDTCWISTSNIRGVVDRRQLWGAGEGDIRPLIL